MNMQQLATNHIDSVGKPVAADTQNEIRRVLYRIRDFG